MEACAADTIVLKQEVIDYSMSSTYFLGAYITNFLLQ